MEMFTINISKEEVLDDVPRIKEWIAIAEERFGKIINENNISFYYTYSFLAPEEDESEKYYEDLYNRCIDMLYEERFKFELLSVIASVEMKIDDLSISDILDIDLELPSIIKDIVSEVTKVKMILESEYNDNEKVKNSIPDIDSSIVSIEGVKDTLDSKYKESKDFDTDAILDKISKKGIGTLSDDEKDFLNSRSKDL
jgi:hypothetical protein